MNLPERKPVIAINTRHWIPGRMEGIGRYEMNIAVELSRLHPEVEFHWLFDRRPPAEILKPENVTLHVVFPPARLPILIYLWYEWAVPLLLKKINANLFLSADNINSLRCKCPTITVIHDIGFEHAPADMPDQYSRFYKEKTPKFIAKATRVVTVSQFSKSDIIEAYQTPSEKINIVGNGVADMFAPLTQNKISEIRNALTGGRPYFFVLGSLHPRKNLRKTIEAYLLFRTEFGSEYPLVISGRPLWNDPKMIKLLNDTSYSNDIIFTGYLNDQDVANTMGAAFSLLFMSTWEGFGVPVIEAFACGVPVIGSNISAIPEVAGDSALLVSPASVDDVSAAMKRLVTDEILRQELVSKGLLSAQKHSWKNSAIDMWKVIESVLH